MRIEYDDEQFTEEEKANTPKRVKRFHDEWRNCHEFEFTTFENPGYDQLIILRDIDFASLCAHHLLPFTGRAHVGYLPKSKICGISKLARAVDSAAARPQNQERMTAQIADLIEKRLDPRGCMVVVEGRHECMRIRGVKKPASVMVTSALRGAFRDNPSLKDEFLRLIQGRAGI